MPTPLDWTPIFGIEFRFASASNPTAAASLNKAYSEIIGKDELSEFFVTCEADAKEDEGPLEIAPDPQLHILNCIAKAIAINLIDPLDEVTKGHIANLLNKCVIKHVGNNRSTKRMRRKPEFDAAAKHVIQTNTDEEPTVFIELTITHWRFRPNWNASLFNKYEDQSVIIPSSPATIPSNTSKDNVLPSSFLNLFMQAFTGDPPSTTAKLLPVQPAKANVNMIVPSASTGLVHTKATVSNPIKTPWNFTQLGSHSASWSHCRYSLLRSGSVSFQCVTSLSPPVQRRDKSPPCEPTNFRWTVNPHSETVVFHRWLKQAPVPLKPSLQLPLFNAIPEDTILASAIPTFAKHRPYSSHFQCEIYSNPNQTVFRITKRPDVHLHEDLVVSLTKRHHDALKIKLYHLHANTLSMNWFYDTID
eukprot:jgi/Psemu1/27387/gm1.27387_g